MRHNWIPAGMNIASNILHDLLNFSYNTLKKPESNQVLSVFFPKEILKTCWSLVLHGVMIFYCFSIASRTDNFINYKFKDD